MNFNFLCTKRVVSHSLNICRKSIMSGGKPSMPLLNEVEEILVEYVTPATFMETYIGTNAA